MLGSTSGGPGSQQVCTFRGGTLVSQSAAASLVRLSVSSGTRRADLGIPGSIPVAEIIPDLARELGVLEPHSASLGYRLMRADGSTVDSDRSLAAQGIEDGSVLALEPNRVDGDTQPGGGDILPLTRPRISTITSETGAVTTVDLSHPECVRGSRNR